MTPKDKTDWQAVAYTLETMEGKVEGTQKAREVLEALLNRMYAKGPSPKEYASVLISNDDTDALTVALKVMEEFEGMEKALQAQHEATDKLWNERTELRAELTALKQRVTVEKIQTIIDIWIHDEGLGEYDKIPKIAEYDSLALALHKEIWKGD